MPTMAWLDRAQCGAVTGALSAVPLASHRTDIYLAEVRDGGVLMPVGPSLAISRAELMHLWNASHALEVELHLDVAGAVLHWRARACVRTPFMLSPDVLQSLKTLLSTVPLEVAEFPSRFVTPTDEEQIAPALTAALNGRVVQSRCLPIGAGYYYDMQLHLLTTRARPSVVFPPAGIVWEAPVDARRRDVVSRVVRAVQADDDVQYPTLLLTQTVRYWRGACDLVIEHAHELSKVAEPAPAGQLICVHHRLLDALPKGQVWALVVFDDAEAYFPKVGDELRALRRLMLTDAYGLLPPYCVDAFVTDRHSLTNCERFNVRACVMRMPHAARAPVQEISCASDEDGFALSVGFQLQYVPACFAMRVLSRMRGTHQFVHETARAFAQGRTECAVCYEAADTITECGHVLCIRCVRRWFRQERHCPSCRQPVARAFTTNLAYHARGAAIVDAVNGEDTLVVCDERRPTLHAALMRYFHQCHTRHITLVKTGHALPPRRAPPCIVFAHAPASSAAADILYRRACALSKRVYVVNDAPPTPNS